MRSGLPEGFIVLDLPWCHEVGFIQWLYVISTAVRSGHQRFIIIIITTTPFEVEGREVGYPTVYDEYMVRYMMGMWYGI